MKFDDGGCEGQTLGRLLQPAVMTLLAGEPLHGYLIVRRLAEMRLMKGHMPDPAGVYRLLKSMEADAIISSTLDSSDSGPQKRRFSLTAHGQHCLERWMATLDEYAGAVGELVNAIKQVRPPRPGKTLSLPQNCAITTFTVNGKTVDSLDLKAMLLTQGIHVPEAVYARFSATHRICANPLECSVLFLPDNTAVHIASVGSSGAFSLSLGNDGALHLLHHGKLVSHVTLPPATKFYDQTTSRGVNYRGMAVLQGHDVLAFPYLWTCEYAGAGKACQFCHCGYYTQLQTAMGSTLTQTFTAQDVAEAVHYAVVTEKCARYVQLTGGSTLQINGEYARYAEMLRAIDATTGLGNIPGEVIIYTTPAKDPRQVDQLFAAGVDRVACDIEIWDEDLARQICPGKYTWTSRQQHLDALEYIAKVHGRNKACSTFVIGLEPADSFLDGAEYLAKRGIVPIPSLLLPHGLPPIATNVKVDLDFWRDISHGLAVIYNTYGCEPPGTMGFNVCLCRDTWNHRQEILSAV